MWKCLHTHICIPMDRICNFVSLGDCCTHYGGDGADANLCRDYSDQDEEMCKSHLCTPGFSKISSGKCVKDPLICDGRLDAKGGLDEIDCKSHVCSSGFIKCADMKTCVRVSFLYWYKSFRVYQTSNHYQLSANMASNSVGTRDVRPLTSRSKFFQFHAVFS